MQGYLTIGEMTLPLEFASGPSFPDGRRAILDGDRLTVGETGWWVLHAAEGDRLWVHLGGRIHELRWRDPVAYHEAAAAEGGDNIITAPMPGVVVRLIAADGAEVGEGDALLVIESMKLETTLRAPAGGLVALHVAAGQGFDRGTPLATITPKD